MLKSIASKVMRVQRATVFYAVILAVLVALMVVVAVSAATRPAEAAFPGSNGAIAFDDNNQMYRMNSDGFGQTKLSDALGFNGEPDWSADGKKMAFVNLNNGNREVYWMNSDGSGETNLTKNAANDLDPAFFPDHHKIAFASDLFVGDDFDPEWSPNGTKIAFS